MIVMKQEYEKTYEVREMKKKEKKRRKIAVVKRMEIIKKEKPLHT